MMPTVARFIIIFVNIEATKKWFDSCEYLMEYIIDHDTYWFGLLFWGLNFDLIVIHSVCVKYS